MFWLGHHHTLKQNPTPRLGARDWSGAGPTEAEVCVVSSWALSPVLGVMFSESPDAPACNVLFNNLLLNYKVAAPAARFVFKASESQLVDSAV